MLVKQFGKPKSEENLSDDKEKTKNSNELDSKLYTEDLSNDQSNLAKDSKEFENKLDDKSEKDHNIDNKDSNKKQD